MLITRCGWLVSELQWSLTVLDIKGEFVRIREVEEKNVTRNGREGMQFHLINLIYFFIPRCSWNLKFNSSVSLTSKFYILENFLAIAI